MTMRRIVASSLLLVTLAGCRSRGEIDILERELRLHEDKIYQLQDELQGAQAELEACQRENDALRAQLDRGGAGATTAPPPRSRTPAPPAPEADVAPPAESAPQVELGTPATREDLPGPAPDDPADSEIELQSGHIPAAARLAGISIHRLLSGGRDFDGHAGDDGLAVVIEQRDAAGNLVRAPGRLRLALEDPSQRGHWARIAQWDFSAAEVKAHYRQTATGGGLHFDLPWPGRPPEVSRLRLVAQLTDSSGKVFAAAQMIEVNPPADWGPRSPGWGDPASEPTAPRRPRPLPDRAGASRRLGAEGAAGTTNAAAPVSARPPSSHDLPTGRAVRPTWRPYR
jgi:hypothetical protein